ncbi:hypothetical protein [Mesotoga sp. HF07.pep.5.2.highcov]|nr:hypothetical protein [Mesotoga sp. HF07.pep.5.2.highcov]
MKIVSVSLGVKPGFEVGWTLFYFKLGNVFTLFACQFLDFSE